MGIEFMAANRIASVETISTHYPPLIDPASYYILRLEDGTKLQVDAGAAPRPPRATNAVLATHWHWDHLYGLVGAEPARVYVSKATFALINGAKALERMRNVVEAVIGGDVWENIADAASLFSSRYDEIRESLLYRHEIVFLEELEEPPYGFRIIRCPGHSEDHLCYLKDGRIFVGDNVVYPGAVSLTHVLKYRESMENILSEPGWHTLYPGHGEPIDRRRALNWFLKTYLSKERRMCRLASLLGSGGGLENIIEKLYGNLSGVLYYVAARSLLGYLRALEDMGVITVNRSTSPWRISVLSPRGITGE